MERADRALWPWALIAVAWKHRNVWIDTSAHVPKHYPPAFVHFMKTFGKDKAKKGYKAAQKSVMLGDASALSSPELAGKLPRV